MKTGGFFNQLYNKFKIIIAESPMVLSAFTNLKELSFGHVYLFNQPHFAEPNTHNKRLGRVVPG